MREHIRISLTDDEFDALTPMEQALAVRLARRHAAPSPDRPTKPIKFTVVEDPAGVANAMEGKQDDNGGLDVTEFYNLPKPARNR